MRHVRFWTRRFAVGPYLVSAMLSASCAQVGTPSGGPVDETPPRVVATTPSDNSVMVSRDSDVTIRFSETMRTETVDRALYITPYPDPYPLLRWSSDYRRVRVDFDRNLEENQTYIVTLGTDAADARGNRLSQAHTFAFSTGADIDSGTVSGTVFEVRDGVPQPKVGATVGLYRLSEQTNEPDPTSTYAGFQTQTGNGGMFQFGYLSPGRYRVLAWSDNGNALLDPGETLGVTSEDTELTDDYLTAETRPILLHAYDPDGPELRLLRAVDRNRVELEFNEPVLTNSIEFHIVAPETLSTSVIPSHTPSPTVAVWTERQSPGTAYGVSIVARDVAGNLSEFGADTTVFDGVSLADTTAPQHTAAVLPQPLIGSKLDSLVLWFSDHLGYVPFDSLSVLEDSIRVEGRWSKVDPNRVVYYPTRALSRESVTWRIPLNHVTDHAGNARSDTLSIPIRYVPTDSLGELSGTITKANDGTKRIIVRALPLRGKWSIDTVVEDDFSWEFTAVPAGDYRLFTWDDQDGNDEWTTGHAVPFKPSERWTLSDTVSVRARWSSTGMSIEF